MHFRVRSLAEFEQARPVIFKPVLDGLGALSKNRLLKSSKVTSQRFLKELPLRLRAMGNETTQKQTGTKKA
jgi:hypothetical protein